MPMLVPSANSTSSSRSPQQASRSGPRGWRSRGTQSIRPTWWSASASMSSRSTVPQRVCTAALSRSRLAGSGCLASFGHGDPRPPGPGADAAPRRCRRAPRAASRSLQRGAQFAAAGAVMNVGRVQRLAQRGVVLAAVGVEIGRQVDAPGCASGPRRRPTPPGGGSPRAARSARTARTGSARPAPPSSRSSTTAVRQSAGTIPSSGTVLRGGVEADARGGAA